MKGHICFVFCVLAIYDRECESLKILKNIRDLLHPPRTTTTLATIVPIYSSSEDYRPDVDSTSTPPWTAKGVGGPFDSFTNGLMPPSKDSNNENKNQYSPPNLSTTSQPQQAFSEKNSGIEKFETKESIYISPSTERSVFSNNGDNPPSNNNVNIKEENNGDNTLSNPGKQLFPYQPNSNRDCTTDLPYELTTIEIVHNVDDYTTKTVQKQPTNTDKVDPVSNDNYNQQQPPNSNNQQELTNNKKEQKSNTGYEHSTIPEEDYQPPLDLDKQHKQTANNQFHNNATSSNQKNKELSTQTQGEIPFEEGGPIVFPTEAESGAYLEPTRKYVKANANKGSFYAESTTSRTAAKAPVPVPVDGGRVIIDAPTKVCPVGSQLDEGVCREIAS